MMQIGSGAYLRFFKDFSMISSEFWPILIYNVASVLCGYVFMYSSLSRPQHFSQVDFAHGSTLILLFFSHSEVDWLLCSGSSPAVRRQNFSLICPKGQVMLVQCFCAIMDFNIQRASFGLQRLTCNSMLVEVLTLVDVQLSAFDSRHPVATYALKSCGSSKSEAFVFT